MNETQKRIIVVADIKGEPELKGMGGDLIRIETDGRYLVWLDQDTMPTRFNPDEVEEVQDQTPPTIDNT